MDGASVTGRLTGRGGNRTLRPPPLEPRNGLVQTGAGPCRITSMSAELGSLGTIDELGLVGRTVFDGKYRVAELVGRGATGVVYKAMHRDLERPVALKILHPYLLRRAEASARFRHEAQSAASLEHRNSVRVLDYGIDSETGYHFLVMEFLEGSSLHDVLEEQAPLKLPRAILMMSQLLGALAAAHDKGIVHRDVKPDNVLVVTRVDDDGKSFEAVKVLDFGIAQALDKPQLKPGASNGLYGTPDFMAPEQIRQQEVDARADIYSCGVILYWMVTGRVPFQARTTASLLVKHLDEKPIPPSHLVNASAAIDKIVLKALDKDPDGRFASARAMRTALRALYGLDGGSSVTALADLGVGEKSRSGIKLLEEHLKKVTAEHRIRTLEEAPPPPRRWHWAVVGAVLALVAAGAFFLMRSLSGETPALPVAPTADGAVAASAPDVPSVAAPDPEVVPDVVQPSGRVTVDEVWARGGLPSPAIGAAIEARLEAFQACFAAADEAEGYEPGKAIGVRVRLRVHRDENDDQLRVSGADTVAVATCVTEVARGLQAELRPPVGTVNASFALRYQPL